MVNVSIYPDTVTELCPAWSVCLLAWFSNLVGVVSETGSFVFEVPFNIVSLDEVLII